MPSLTACSVEFSQNTVPDSHSDVGVCICSAKHRGHHLQLHASFMLLASLLDKVVLTACLYWEQQNSNTLQENLWLSAQSQGRYCAGCVCEPARVRGVEGHCCGICVVLEVYPGGVLLHSCMWALCASLLHC